MASEAPLPRISRRELFARILLLGDPDELKEMTSLGTAVAVEFATIAAAKAWLTAAGLDKDYHLYDRVNDTHTDGITRRHFSAYPTWHGWALYVAANEPVEGQAPDLDEDTSSRLREIAGGDQ